MIPSNTILSGGPPTVAVHVLPAQPGDPVKEGRLEVTAHLDPGNTNRDVIKTVLEIDLVSYSDIARVLEEYLNVEAVKSFQDQIQEFVDYGLKTVGLDREEIVLGTAGDNAILIFDTAVAMHNFAQAVHQETSRYNASKSIPMAQRWFRMGAATGMVMVVPRERRIVGVTIARAVRLEAAAKKGQLVIDSETYQRLPKEIQDAYGPEEIIPGKRTEQFRGHRCTLVDLPEEADRDLHRDALRKRTAAFLTGRQGIGAIGAALALAIAAWWVWPMTRPSPTAGPMEAASTSTIQPMVAPRLSIVVLPFTNLSNDPDQQYFADGITEDLTTDLSRIAHLLVISRNTAFTYKDKPVNAKQVGRELAVRYLLEGSVQRSGAQVRVNAELIDAETDTHLWAERFDHDVDDLLALQNDVTHRIAEALSAELVSAKAARPTQYPDAFDYILRARAALNKGNTPKHLSQAVDLYEHALALNPRSVEAQSLLALTVIGRILAGMTSSRADDFTRANNMLWKNAASATALRNSYIERTPQLPKTAMQSSFLE